MADASDITGRTFGAWTVLRPTGKRNGSQLWICRCTCGTERAVVGNTMTAGISRCCGCIRPIENLTGRRFGARVVLGFHGRNKHKQLLWDCRCDCGKEHTVISQQVKAGKTLSCGCDRYVKIAKAKTIDLAGTVRGFWSVISCAGKAGKNGDLHWNCRCECGVERVVSGMALRAGLTKSCGCKRGDLYRASRKFEPRTHPLLNNECRLFRIWKGIKQRTNPSNAARFPGYAGRGITLCDRWQNFYNFYADVGPTHRYPLSLERSNNDLGYSPENCTWADAKQQANNRRPPSRKMV